MFTNLIRCINPTETQEVLETKYQSLEKKKEINWCSSAYIVSIVFMQNQTPITHCYKSGAEQFLKSVYLQN